ncbi:MAG TPA: P-loop NTPase fold protein, partial [Actinomycetota bacterium]|nr:P-loop NTPase fold protein [Actinomycetota bacterium]
LDPVTVGIHGPWGSGKSTVLKLLEAEFTDKYVVVSTSPWEYEDHDDVKGTLIGEVLRALEDRATGQQTWAKNARKSIQKLAKRVSWSRVGMAVAKGTVTMAWDPEKLLEAFTLQPKEPRSLIGFREEFEKLTASMEGVDRVVVLVDDLDRCLPPAVVQTLEAIKLFLSVKKMVFVLAADKELVRDSIAAYLPGTNRADAIASNYLEKIIQIPVYLPRLPFHDAEAYIGLLLCSHTADAEGLQELIDHCEERRGSGFAPLLAGFPEGFAQPPDQETLRLAAQIAKGLGGERVGNPREIKRFLNAFGIRRSIATARGIEIRADVLAKLLILEDRYRDAFDRLATEEPEKRSEFLAAWEKWAREGESDPPDPVLKPTKAWAESEPFVADLEMGQYITLAAALAASAAGAVMDEHVLSLVHRLLGPSDADRQLAVKEIPILEPERRRALANALFERLRRAEEIEPPVTALVLLVEAAPELAADVASEIGSIDRKLFTPAAGVELALAGAIELQDLARSLSADDKVDAGTRTAVDEALK